MWPSLLSTLPAEITGFASVIAAIVLLFSGQFARGFVSPHEPLSSVSVDIPRFAADGLPGFDRFCACRAENEKCQCVLLFVFPITVAQDFRDNLTLTDMLWAAVAAVENVFLVADEVADDYVASCF